MVGFFGREILRNVLFTVGENFRVVFSVEELINVLDVLNASPGLLSEEVGVGIGQYLEAHLVPDLLKIMVELIRDEELGILTKPAFKDGKHEATESCQGVSVDFRKEDIGAFGELLLMIFYESLEAGGHVEYVFLLIDCKDDGGDILLEVVLDELKVNPHG